MSDIKSFFKMLVQTNQPVTIYADKCGNDIGDDYFFILTAPNRDWVGIEIQTEGAHPEMVKFADKLFLDGVNVDLNSSDVPPAALSAIMLSLLTNA